MKKLLLLLLLCISLVSYAQGVPGIRLGDSYDKVKQTLIRNYGTKKMFETKDRIHVGDPVVHGIRYDFLQCEMASQRLAKIHLSISYELNEFSKAKKKRDELARFYRKTHPEMYEDIEVNTGIKWYRTKEMLIGIDKGKSIDHSTRYYVRVLYK